MNNSREAPDDRPLQDRLHGHAGELCNNTMKPFPGQLEAVELLIQGANRIAELEKEVQDLLRLG